MKKTIILCILSALCLTACSADQPAAAPVGADNSADAAADAVQITEIAPEEGDTLCETYWTDENQPVSAETEQPSYRPDTEVIRVTVTNRSDAEYCFAASEFLLFRMENGQAEAVPYAAESDCFNAMAQIAPPHETTVFTADIAGHYDLPLAEGAYKLWIPGPGGEGLTADFEIAADAPLPDAPEQTQPVTVGMVQTEYPADTAEISVLLTNTGSETADIAFADFGLEHFLGEAVSYAPFSRDPVEHFADIRGVQLEPGKEYTWNVKLSDFGGTVPEAGEYAITFRNQEAKFTIGE